MNIKKNFTLIVGISIPVVMVLLVAAAIYIPRLFVHPGYNFLYATGDYYGQRYEVQDGKLLKQPSTPQNQADPSKEPKLYIYDVSSNQSSQISFPDAQGLNLDSGLVSPDGFEIVDGGHRGGLLLFDSGEDYNARYLSGHNVSRKLDLHYTGSSYYIDFHFIGWIN